LSETVGMVVGVVLALIVVSFILGIGMFIYYQAYSTISSLNLGATGNTTRTTIDTNVWNAFQVLTPLPIILGASAVITALLAGFLWIRSR